MKLIALTRIETKDGVIAKGTEWDEKDTAEARRLISVGGAITPKEKEKLEEEAEASDRATTVAGTS